MGRLPARDLAELQTMVGKILRYPKERAGQDPFPAVHLIAGHHGAPPAFEKMADGLNNAMALRLLTKLPAPWRFDGSVHINGSPWQISGEDVPATARRMMSGNATLLAFMGHSEPARAMSKAQALLSAADWKALPAGGPHPGLFFTCGCESCELSPVVESYGFAAIRAPGGPPAVIGSHGLTWAAMGYLAISGLIDRIAADPAPSRPGTFWLGVQQGLAKGEISSSEFAMLDMADGSAGKVPLEQQRLEHLESWMLLGDPAMPLLPPVPAITIDPTIPPIAGKPLTISGNLPDGLAGATVRITFERHPATIRTDLPEIPLSGAARLAATRELSRLSGDVVLATTTAITKGTTFTASLTLPSPLPPGPWTIRALSPHPTGGGILQIR